MTRESTESELKKGLGGNVYPTQVLDRIFLQDGYYKLFIYRMDARGVRMGAANDDAG
jgi:hypothetical protein